MTDAGLLQLEQDNNNIISCCTAQYAGIPHFGLRLKLRYGHRYMHPVSQEDRLEDPCASYSVAV